MSCLVHHPRFRSSFHNIINELRNENRMPITVLRTMPNQCCTCKTEQSDRIDSAMIKDDHELEKLKSLMQRINLEKPLNSKLVLSLNRFTNLIEENRCPAPPVSEPEPEQKERKRSVSSSSSESRSSSDSDEDVVPMDTFITRAKPVRFGRAQRTKKPSKPIRNGTFVFLPYVIKGKTHGKSSDTLLEVAKKLQCSRFFGRIGHIGALEKQFDARINMITPKTSQQVIDALENAKKGFESLKIHGDSDSLARSELQAGEWFLVRSKKPAKQTNVEEFEHLLDDLTTRWNTCFGNSQT